MPFVDITNKTFRRLVHVGFWMVYYFSVLFVSINVLGYNLAFVRGLFNVAMFAALFYINSNWLVPQYLQQNRRKQYLLIGFLFWSLFSWVRAYIGYKYFVNHTIDLPLFDSIGNLLVAACLSNGGVMLISTIYRLAEDNLNMVKLKDLRVREQKEAQLNYLMAQINPHFLFNTLNNIYSLAYSKSEKTAEMILKLSELLKFVIYDCRSGKVSLEKEINNLKLLIDLYQMRFEEPANITLDVKGRGNHNIEPMLLIPLAENALKHNDLDTNENGYIKMKLVRRMWKIEFTTENTFDPTNKSKDDIGGVGLNNILKRLELNYLDDYEFRTEDKGNTFHTLLKLKINR